MKNKEFKISMANMKVIFKRAHLYTKQDVKKYEVDYRVQFGLHVKHLCNLCKENKIERMLDFNFEKYVISNNRSVNFTNVSIHEFLQISKLVGKTDMSKEIKQKLNTRIKDIVKELYTSMVRFNENVDYGNYLQNKFERIDFYCGMKKEV